MEIEFMAHALHETHLKFRRRIGAPLIALVILIGLGGVAKAESESLPSQSCPAFFAAADRSARSELEMKFAKIRKKRPQIVWSETVNSEGDKYDSLELYEAGRTHDIMYLIGSFTFKIKKQGRVLKVGWVSVEPEYRKRGVSEFMLAEILARHPKIEKIVTLLTSTNKAVLKEKLDDGLDCLSALQQTPAYLMRASQGFRKITKFKCGRLPKFTVIRE